MILYQEDFTLPDGPTLPAGWSEYSSEGGGTSAINNNRLELLLNHPGGAVNSAVQVRQTGYTVPLSSPWECVTDTDLVDVNPAMPHNFFYISFGYTGGFVSVELHYNSVTESYELVLRQFPTVIGTFYISSTPNAVRFRRVADDLLVDYDLGSGYEFDGGGPAVFVDIFLSLIPAYFGYSFVNGDSTAGNFSSYIDNHIITGEEVFSNFWGEFTLQAESGNSGRLTKKRTLDYIKTVGQSYVPPSLGTSEKTVSSTGTNYLCKRVI